MNPATIQTSICTLPSAPAARLRLAIGVATRGRPSVLADTLDHLRAQRRRPDTVLVAYAGPTDIADAQERFPEIRFILSEVGLTKQRNMILESLSDEDVITFLDDDFYLHSEYLAIIEKVFIATPTLAVATGKLLADGINGPGLSLDQANVFLQTPPPFKDISILTRAFNAYGCNMSFRMEHIRNRGLRFDENLPLYGWYEDVDFSRQLSRYGDIVQVNSAYGVHLGVKSGRQSGIRLGYSQVANPVYLAKKRSVSWLYALASVTSRSLKNLLLSAAPEPGIDRRGRLRGNILGIRDLVLGTLSPRRILDF